MLRKSIQIKIEEFPETFHPFLEGCRVYDSSCSPQAKVLFLDKGNGYYLKRSAKGTLEREALLTDFFHSKGLATEVLAYESLDWDWLMTARVPGEDCCDAAYIAEPERLCVLYAKILRSLHETTITDCPVQNRTAEYLQTAERNYKAGMFDPDYLPADARFPDAESAYRFAMDHAHLLKNDTLIHGDYCLPNIMLDRWEFSKFIDLGNGGVGDRHIDLFWGIWSLNYNLKTDQYRDLFLDAYGRDLVDETLLQVIGAIECFG